MTWIHLLKKFAKPVVNFLKSLGLNAEFTGRNDIQIDGAKVSGNAQYQNKRKDFTSWILFYLKQIYNNLSNSLKSRDIKFKGKAVQSVRSRVGFIGDMIDMDVETFMDKAIAYIKDEYKITNITTLSTEEMKKIYEIRDSLFATKNWNYGNGSLKKNRKAEKYSCGVVEIGLDIENGRIKDISIEGDFFSELGIDRLCGILKEFNVRKSQLKRLLKILKLTDYIKSWIKKFLLMI